MASFSLKPTEPPWDRTLPLAACLIFAGLAAVVTVPMLSRLPGLHADEAWVGLRAQQIVADGEVSWFGMNTHTGPLHQLLVVLSFGLFGPSVVALRGVGVLTNLLAVVLYAWVTGQLFGRRTAALATALWVSSPFFLVNARVATEHAALSALLALAALACLLRGRRPARLKTAGDPLQTASSADHQIQRRWALAAGVLLGLGTWNHLVFAAVPFTLLGLAVCSFGPQVWHRTEVVWASFGWACVEVGPLSQIGARVRVPGGSEGVATRLAELPRLLAEVWQGDVVALRVAGAVRLAGWPWAVVTLSLACLGLVAAATDLGGGARRARWVLLGGGLLAASTAVLVPHHAERHLLLPFLLLPWLVCEGLTSLLRLCGRSGRTLATVACLALAALQLAASYANLLAPLAHQGVVSRSYNFGAKRETSDHVANTLDLYGSLVARGVTQVRANHFIAAPLRFYDLGHNQLEVAELPAAQHEAVELLAREADAQGAPLLTYGADWQQIHREVAQAREAQAGGGTATVPTRVADLGPFALVEWQPQGGGRAEGEPLAPRSP